MNNRLSNRVLLIATLLGVLFILFAWNNKREETLIAAKGYAQEVLSSRIDSGLKVLGDKSLISNCSNPQIEETYASYEKARYEFRVTCQNKPPYYMLVSTRQIPPKHIVISREGTFKNEQDQ